MYAATSRSRARSMPPSRPRPRLAIATSPPSACCSASRSRTARPAEILKKAGLTPQKLEAAIAELRKGRTAQSSSRRRSVRRAEEIRARSHRGCAQGQARPGDRPRRGNPPHDPGALAPHQEQSGADRRAWRRQNRHRRRLGAAHRQWRRAGKPEAQEAARARHGLARSPARNIAASSKSA